MQIAFSTDYTKPLLFLNESALPSKATHLNLLGNQWGMMNETGAYPGQSWLWLYTFWYQVPVGPFNSPNADITVWLMMARPLSRDTGGRSRASNHSDVGQISLTYPPRFR